MNSKITIYHNNNCSKSCGALLFLQQKGVHLQVIEYVNDHISKEELIEIISMLGIKPSELIRTHEPVFQENFTGKNYSDDQYLEMMLKYPELIERPIVVKDGKAIIARPQEKILELMNER